MKNGLKMGNKKENSLVVKLLLFPTLVISFILFFIYPPDRLAFGLYLIMGIWALNAYRQSTYQEEVYGIKKGFIKNYVWGIAIGGVFLIVTSLVPTFSLLAPSFSFSVSSDVRFFIIVILAGIMEECWRSSTIAYIKDIYKPKSFLVTNVSQAGIFSGLHVLVYGLVLGMFTTWFEAFGVIPSILGSLLAAFVFGMVSGYMMEKFDDIIPSIAAHQTINFWLVKEGFVVVALGLLTIKHIKKYNEKIKRR